MWLLGNEMNPYSLMLEKAATEIHEYRQHRPVKAFDDAWLEGLMIRMRRASAVSVKELAEREIDLISRMLTDSGPLPQEFAPTFGVALDALQRSRKRNPRKQ